MRSAGTYEYGNIDFVFFGIVCLCYAETEPDAAGIKQCNQPAATVRRPAGSGTSGA